MNEPYQIHEWVRVSQLGQGGFGVVTLWKNTETEESIAVKKCRFSEKSSLTPRQKERWCSEVKMMKEISCPNIPSFKVLPTKLDIVLSRHNPSKLPILSMEYCSKGNLRHLLTNPENTCGLQETDVKIILSDLSNAVNYLHNLNITHRDLKPENIVLQETDERPNKIIYKVIDLGYAKELNSVCASFVGTLQYLAPEIFLRSDYDSTVDYWSLGNIVFEIASGVHPFLPFHPPPDRFNYIRKKHPDHIYIKDTGKGIKFLSKIPEETHLSTCLKYDLEKWLQLILQFEPSQRGTKNGTNIFDQLKKIVNKKTVRIFSVYTYEFYHYEITDTTLLSTLQDWFARDTKIQKEEQLILTDWFFFDYDENRKVVDCFCDDLNSTIYIFKNDSSVNPTVKSHIPQLVKQLFTDLKVQEHSWNEIKLINSHVLFYIKQESKCLESLIQAVDLLTLYINKIIQLENKEFQTVRNDALKLLTEISCYNKLSKGIMKNIGRIKSNPQLVDCFRMLRGKVRKVSVSVDDLNNLSRKQSRLMYNKEIFDAFTKNVVDYFKSCDMEQLYKSALNTVIHSKIEGQKKYSSAEVLQFVDKVLRMRHDIIKHIQEQFFSYFRSIWKIYNRSRKYISKAKELGENFKEYSTCLTKLEVVKYELLFESYKDHSGGVLNVDNLDGLDIDDVLSSNMSLRYGLQDEIDRSLQLHQMNLSIMDSFKQ